MIDNVNHPYTVLKEHWGKILERNGKPPELPLNSLPNVNKLVWGLSKQKLVVVASRPSNGKSALLLQMAWDLAQQGKDVLFFSFEMSKEMCIERIISNDLEIDNFLLRNGKVSILAENEGFNNRFTDFAKRLDSTTFTLVEKVGNTLPEMREILKTLGKPPDIVFIDYGNLVKSQARKTKKEIYDEYLVELRATAIQNNFCAVIGSQVNRSVYYNGKVSSPTLYNLKDTGELEQTADMVWLLHWEFYHNREDPTKKNDYKIDIAKNRDGRTGLVKCKFLPEYGKIVDEDKKTWSDDGR